MRRYSPGIFSWTQEADWQERKVPPVFRTSIFAAFLSKIGKENAAQITRLSVATLYVADELPLVTELVRLHLPSLRSFQVKMTLLEIEEICEYRPAVLWSVKNHESLVRVLRKFVLRVPWWFEHFEFQQEDWDYGGDWEPVRALERLVKDRSRARSQGDAVTSDYHEVDEDEETDEDEYEDESMSEEEY